MKLLLATTSKHKAGEIAAMLRDIPNLTLETLADYPATEAPDEDGSTMMENARIKATFYSQHFGTTVLADDSGLEVDALNGAPGLHAARWVEGSDADRTLALLNKMKDVPESERSARYRCTLCLASPEKILLETEGVCEGEIALHWRGDGGFGYDPIFGITLATGADSQWIGQTMAQVPATVKAQISHRARAVAQFAKELPSLPIPD